MGMNFFLKWKKPSVNQIVKEFGLHFLHCSHGEGIKEQAVEHEWPFISLEINALFNICSC